jgi:hypothetical protein
MATDEKRQVGWRPGVGERRRVDLGVYFGMEVYAFVDNGGVNIDMSDFVCEGEGLRTVFIPDDEMDKLARLWQRYRDGEAFGEVPNEASLAARRRKYIDEVNQLTARALRERKD